MDRLFKLNLLKKQASRLGATDLQTSLRKDKKYVVTYRGRKINFGQVGYEDFLDHRDYERRRKFRARARGIVNKDGQKMYIDRNSPLFWSYHLLW